MEVENPIGVESGQVEQLISILRKNLLWSGMFDIRDSIDEADLKLKIKYTPGKEIRAWIFSQEDILLFDESKSIAVINHVEATILELVEDIILQLTGEKSILRSAIVYVRKNNIENFDKEDNGSYELIITDTFGGKSNVILNDGKFNILPRWNPDGRSILFTSLGRQGSRLKTINIEDGKVQTLFEEMGKLSGGTWGKNGTELIITLVKRGNTDLFRINLKGSILEQMTARSSSESNPRWSPDNQRLLFVSNRSGTVQIYQRDLANNDTFRMTFEGSYNVEPSWSNDGANIVFSGIKDRKFQLFLMDKEGQYVQQLTHDSVSSEQPIWSPNGRQILFIAKVGFDHKLFLIRADGTFRRRLTNSGPGVNEFNPTWTQQFQWKK
jgi:TolB protein